MNLNQIYNENCLDTMKKMEDNFVDMTICSPPYDHARIYNGYTFDFEPIAKELYRVTKDGGVVVWIVNDTTKDHTKSLTSFKQAIFFKEIGFNVRDIMIWEKTGQGCFGSNLCYLQNFEYMFILSKSKIKTFNPIKDRPNKVSGERTANGRRKDDGKYYAKRVINCEEYGKRFNIWRINPQKDKEHPAPFPIQLIKDHIVSWSNEEELIYDPFMGGGTTALASIQLNRNWVGSEISKEYCKLANRRIKEYVGK